MPDLIWFEWKRQRNGYRIEAIDLDWFTREKLESGWLIEEVSKDAPTWVHELVLACDGYSKGLNLAFDHGFITYAKNNCLVPNEPFETETYFPLEQYPALFMEFANTEESVEGVLSFANKYGALHEHTIHYAEPTGLYQVAHLPVYVYRSMQAIKNMKRATGAWFEYRDTGNPNSLIALLPRDRSIIFNEGVKPEWPVFSSHGASLQYKMRMIPGTKKLSMYLAPENLLSCIWVQFLQAVTNDTQLKQCAVCPSWFSFGTGTGRRSSAQYCSDRCRKVSHARRKAEDHNG